MLALPTSSLAQQIAPADLVGSWKEKSDPEKGFHFLFKADSTVTYLAFWLNQSTPVDATGRWRLAGDTLVTSGATAQVGGNTLPAEDARYLVALKEKQLMITKLDETGQKKATKVFTKG